MSKKKPRVVESFPEWTFDFVLQAADGKSVVPETRCEELIDLIIGWADSRDLAIGGGYRKCIPTAE